MKSTLKLYKGCKIYPSKNFIVSNISTYLASLYPEIIYNFQYVKHALSVEVKLNKSETLLDINHTNRYNYCAIQNGTERVYYYFIVDRKWISMDCVKLVLQMDVINSFTYNVDYELDDKTLVHRQHFDRFYRYDDAKDIGGDVYTTTLTEFPDMKEVVINDTFTGGDIYSDNGTMTLKIREVAYGLEINTEITCDHIVFSGTNMYVYYLSVLQATITKTDVESGLYVYTLYQDSGIELDPPEILENFSGIFLPRLRRKIPLISEGINPVLYGKNEELILKDGDDWYLVYKGNSPMRAYLINRDGFSATLDGDNEIEAGDLTANYYYYILPEENDNRVNVVGKSAGNDDVYISAYIETQGPQDFQYIEKTVLCYWRTADDYVAAVVFTYYDLGLGFFYVRSSAEYKFDQLIVYKDDNINTRTLLSKTTNTATIKTGTAGSITITTATYNIKGINSLDRYASDLYKIIKLPYCPVTNWNGWKYDNTEGMIYIEDLDTLFENTLTTSFDPLKELTIIPNPSITTRNKELEAKLFHSDFYQPKFIYDSFSFTFNLELVNADKYVYISTGASFKFNMTNTINSRFMFSFPSYITDGNSLTDYDNVLIVARNNEVSIFTSNFVDYLRNGYNYDVKSKERAEAFQWADLGVGLTSKVATYGIGGGGISGGVSLAGSTITQVLGAINSTISAEASLRQKVYQLSRQTASVRGSDDVDLMSIYASNKAKYMTYKVSDRMKTILADLFYYAGYVDGTNHKPDTDSRIYFNFVSCDAVINNIRDIPEELIDELIIKFKEGVTFLHADYGYDFEQNNENWETLFFEE